MSSDPSNSQLPPEAIALAGRMFDAARSGQLDIFQQALPAGLPANMMNDKGDSLVGFKSLPLKTLDTLMIVPVKSRGHPLTLTFFGHFGS